ncbi:MAG: hypothetical protein ACK57P_15035, partial [Planctomycetota bacterium]
HVASGAPASGSEVGPAAACEHGLAVQGQANRFLTFVATFDWRDGARHHGEKPSVVSRKRPQRS